MSNLISKEKILATIDFADKALDEERTVEMYKALLTECVKVLPSAENKGEDRPQGHWIYPSYPNNYPYMWKSICSNCNTGFPTINKDYKFCPECGCQMNKENNNVNE